MTTSPISECNENGLNIALLSKENLKSDFDYDPEGNLIWIGGRVSGRPKGKRAGWLNPHRGYKELRYKDQVHSLHRLIWIWHYGEIPQGLVVDHIDQDKGNNRIENLRLATRKQNARNGKSRNDLPLGISRSPHGYRVQLTTDDGKRINRRFKSLAEATQCNRELRATHYGEFA